MDYKQRMREELKELEGRCERIGVFLDNSKYDELKDADQILLLTQSVHMSGYALILQERVDRLTRDADAGE